VVINKQLTVSATAAIALTNFLSSGTAQVWQLTSANVITRLSDINFIGTSFSNSLPPQSITLFVLSAGSRPHLRAGLVSSSNTFDFWLDGQSGQRYEIQATMNLVNWVSIQTNTLATASLHVVVPVNNAFRFYRAQWAP